MKSTHEIKERISQLEKFSNEEELLELEILRSALHISEEQIKTVLKNQIEHNQWNTARISLWILEDSLNAGFDEYIPTHKVPME